MNNNKILDALDPEQKAVAEKHGFSIFVSAGAGSGKTYTLSKKIAYEFSNEETDSINPEDVMAITFTTAAARELSNRIQKETKNVSPEKARRIAASRISTIHAACRRLLSEHAFDIGRDAGIVVLDTNEADTILGEIIGDIAFEKDILLDKHQEVITDLVEQIMGSTYAITDDIEDEVLSFHPNDTEEDISDYELWNIANEAAKRYANRLRKRGTLSYDLLIRETSRMLTDNPDISDEMSQRLKMILVDEFQDTNMLQMSFLDKLCGKDKFKKLTCVGDKQQSIYRFNGADVFVSDSVQQEMEEDDPEHIVEITTNYRSKEDILLFVDAVFNDNDDFKDFLPLSCCEENKERSKEYPHVKMIDISVENRKSEYAPAQACVTAIKEAEANGIIKPGHYDDVAILLRKMTHVSEYIEVLGDAGIPSIVSGGSTFYSLDELIPIFDIIQASLDTNNEDRLTCFLASYGMSVDEQIEIKKTLHNKKTNNNDQTHNDQNMHNNKWEEIIKSKDSYPNTIQKLINIIQDTESAIRADIPARDVIAHIIYDTSYASKIFSNDIDAERIWGNLLKLMDLAESLQHNNTRSTRSTLQFLVNQHEIAGRYTSRGIQESNGCLCGNGNPGSVSIMTIHKSKGLQFPLVIVVDIEANDRDKIVFSHVNDCSQKHLTVRRNNNADDPIVKGNNEEKSAEELRLLYVAYTRAQEQLVIINTQQVTKDKVTYGSPRYKTIRKMLKGKINDESFIEFPSHDDVRHDYEYALENGGVFTYIPMNEKYLKDNMKNYQKQSSDIPSMPKRQYIETLTIKKNEREQAKNKYYSFSSISKEDKEKLERDGEVIEKDTTSSALDGSGELKAPKGYEELSVIEPMKLRDEIANERDRQRALSRGGAFHCLVQYGVMPTDELIDQITQENQCQEDADDIKAILGRTFNNAEYKRIWSESKAVFTEVPVFCDLYYSDEENDVLVGYIDLLSIEPDGDYVITDYKTGYMNEDISVDMIRQIYDLQMKIYAYAVLNDCKIKGENSAHVRAQLFMVEWEDENNIIGGGNEKWYWEVDDMNELRDEILEQIRKMKE